MRLSELLTRGAGERGRGPRRLAPGSEVLGVGRKGGEEEEENGGREVCWEESRGELGALELGKVLWSRGSLGKCGSGLGPV